MSSDLPVEKKFKILTEITRASHFAWRQAALECCPGVDAQALVNRMWDITGVQTGTAYLKRLDPKGDLAQQVAGAIVWSSQSMGEDAHLVKGAAPGEWHVKHEGCPWHAWHDRLGLLPEDRPGCDQWFSATVRTINEKLGTKLRFETVKALPDGDDCCLRRFWVEQAK
ncbi:MAG: L-2-amino-thiazoline-4-carboxylic acid hydrolase [Planctomycetes bacterium]|jgi:hypothetical protein|nr:L-2-amino-thiazoline-4-carboxylic acid hydrolase [Planctomycetota bacterium]